MTTNYPRLGLTAACAVLLLATGACDRLKRHGDGEPLPPASASDTAAADKAVAEAKADTAGTADPAPADAAATAEAAPAAPETAAPAEKK